VTKLQPINTRTRTRVNKMEVLNLFVCIRTCWKSRNDITPAADDDKGGEECDEQNETDDIRATPVHHTTHIIIIIIITVKRGFQPNATHATNLRTFRIYEFTQASTNRNPAVLFPAKLEFLRFNYF